MQPIEDLWERYKNDSTPAHSAIERWIIRLRNEYPKNQVGNQFNKWAKSVGIEEASDTFYYLRAKVMEAYDFK